MGKKRGKTFTLKKCKFCGKEYMAKTNQQYCSRRCSTNWRKMFGQAYVPYPKGKMKDTLCWECKRATGGSFRPWANWFIPVEGWKATPTRLKMGNNRTITSYDVHECPIFERG